MKDDILQRLRSHPVYKRAMSTVSESERKQIEERVESFAGDLAKTFSQVAATPNARETLQSVAKGVAPSVSGSSESA